MYRLFFESEFLSEGDCAKTTLTIRVNNTLKKYFIIKYSVCKKKAFKMQS